MKKLFSSLSMMHVILRVGNFLDYTSGELFVDSQTVSNNTVQNTNRFHNIRQPANGQIRLNTVLENVLTKNYSQSLRSHHRSNATKHSIGRGNNHNSHGHHSNDQTLLSNHNDDRENRNYLKSKGRNSIVPNITVHGAIIVSDYPSKSHTSNTTNPILLKEYNDKMALITARLKNIQDLMNLLPFPLVEWPSLFSKPCPHFAQGHKTERGLAIAHYRIWLDFIYFDREVLERMDHLKHDNYYASEDNNYIMYTTTNHSANTTINGKLYKNGNLFSEDDIIVIFEDDADSAIIDLNTTMIEELSKMTTDVLFLGWCDGRAARPVPLCMHAYALTRRGARKFVKYFEPCGRAIDEQLVIIAKNGWLTFRKVFPYSYKNLNSNYPVPGDKNFGIFRQKKWLLGSINGH
eukprot:gene11060-14845_t